MHGEGHLFRTGHRVGREGDEVGVEGVVAAVAQALGYAGALLVEGVAIEDVAGADDTADSVGDDDVGDAGVVDFVIESRDDARRTGRDVVRDAGALASGVHDRVDSDRGVHVSAVDDSLAQLARGELGEERVVDDGRLAQVAEPAVVPFRAVAARERVGGEAQTCETEHLVVGLLAEEIDEVGTLGERVAGRVFADVNVHAVKKILALGDMLDRAAGPHQEHRRRHK